MRPKPFRGEPATTKRRGTVSYGALTNGASTTGAVTFPTPFGAEPDITITTTSSRVTIAVTSSSASGFNWSASNWSGGSVISGQTTAQWVACAP